MKYEVLLRERVIDLLIAWKPPDFVLDELERFLDEQLAVNPVECLRQVKATSAMECHCTIPEPDAGRIHVFILRVHYGEDETTLFVYDAFYYELGS